ncbi:27188_t:CDS:2 [Dentiscutata erythropus]|uniref:27188_t:CDS:1 n=1 Tax=Dentiscutata erythropus TaxID=1348616 RepID=A0A9N9C5C8_9GLOM|nr:27188_t:CDS:2 [Dentiscutata erythropus]
MIHQLSRLVSLLTKYYQLVQILDQLIPPIRISDIIWSLASLTQSPNQSLGSNLTEHLSPVQFQETSESSDDYEPNSDLSNSFSKSFQEDSVLTLTSCTLDIQDNDSF